MNKRVLIFDDDLDILQVSTMILRKKGFEVFSVNHSKDVLEKVHLYKPNIILMDNAMPGVGGVEATRLIKKTAGMNQIPVIFFTANNNIMQLAKKARADYFLQKPFAIVDLEKVIVDAAGNPAAS